MNIIRKVILNTAATIVMGTVSVTGYAAGTASLSVTGSIIPSTCDLALSTTSIDFGSLSISSLTSNINGYYANDIMVDVACDAATAVAVQTTDNRIASAMTTAEMASETGTGMSGFIDAQLFGLGTDSTNAKIGGLVLGISAATLNGSPNNYLLTSTDKATWTAQTVSTAAPLSISKGGYFTLGATAGTTSPTTITNSTYTIISGLLLKKADKYPSGEIVNIDGNITFSVVYL